MKKRNIYIIIGEGKCGKSSLVRALTGVFRKVKPPTRIRLKDGPIIKVHVWPQSAQEAWLSPPQILTAVNNSLAENILLVLRFHPAKHMIKHVATEYVDLLKEHHNITQVVFMGPNDEVQSVPTPGVTNPLRKCKSNPVNENASQVRGWWGWI